MSSTCTTTLPPDPDGKGVMALIPALNEAATVGCIVAEARTHVEQVLVVDDGSSDATSEEAQRAGAAVERFEVTQGKGQALRHGFEFARKRGYSWVVTLDADGQHNPKDIPAFIATAHRTGADVVIGNRLSDLRRMPLRRRMANLFSTRLLSLLAGFRLPDTQSGFRLIRREVWERAAPRAGRFSAESEFMVLAARGKARIESQVIATVYGGRPSRYRMVGDSMRFLGLCTRLTWRIFRGF